MSRVPAPSRRVLTALMDGFQPSPLPPPAEGRVGRMLNDLLTLLERQDEALAALDRLAAQVDGGDEAEAAYRSAGAQVARLADATADAAAALLLAPVECDHDLQFKLMVLISTCEPHPDDAYIFPSLYLRALLIDLRSHTLSIKSGFIELYHHSAHY